MKGLKALATLAALSIVLSYSGVRAATSHAAAKSAAAVSEETKPAETYTGTIVLLNGSLYILRDEQNDSWYHLDDQQKPAKLLVKKVVVTGKLNAGVNVINVRDIEPMNG